MEEKKKKKKKKKKKGKERKRKGQLSGQGGVGVVIVIPSVLCIEKGNKKEVGESAGWLLPGSWMDIYDT